MAKDNLGFEMEERNNAETSNPSMQTPTGILQAYGSPIHQPKLKQVTVFPSQFDPNLFLNNSKRAFKPIKNFVDNGLGDTIGSSKFNTANNSNNNNIESYDDDNNRRKNLVESGSDDSIGDNNRRKQKMKKIIITIFAILLYSLYFAAVLILQSDNKPDDYWCDGDGLLIIITAIVTSMLLYFKVVKPLVGRKIYKKVMRPIGRKINTWTSVWWMSYILYMSVIGLILAYLIYDSRKEIPRLISLVGIVVLLLFGYIFSAARKKIVWRQVIWGIGLQFCLGFFILKLSVGRSIFECFGDKVDTFLKFTDVGSGFVFGELSTKMAIFAFSVLSIILFFSFCIQILYYYGAMQWLVKKIGWLLQITMGTTACESLNAAGNIFLGQTEAPLMIKPFLSKMTKSEIHAVMTGGFATIAGSVMAAYISFGVSPVHLLTASVMSAPAALAYSKLFYPETEVSATQSKDIKIEKGKEANVLHAAIEGVTNAIPLVANIAANLIAVVSFIALVDAVLNWSCILLSLDDGVCSLSKLFGYVLMPLAWVMGVPWEDCYTVGQLIGVKTMLNEFVAYVQLADNIKNHNLTKRGELIATFALCGFANISSIGIMLGGLGAMAPHRKADMSKLVFRAMIAGNIASFLTACVAGSLISIDSNVLPMNATFPILNVTEALNMTTVDSLIL